MVQKYRKEDNVMTEKNSRKSVKVVKTVLEAVLKIDANTASSWIAYQPEMPSEIKKFKKVR
jgi:cyclic lactone autoinducer peptide